MTAANTSVSLFDLINRKNKSKVYKSVSVLRDGNIAVERYDDNYDVSTASAYRATQERIIKALVRELPRIESEGFFDGDDSSFKKFGYREVTFYSTYGGGFGVVALFKDKDNTYTTI